MEGVFKYVEHQHTNDGSEEVNSLLILGVRPSRWSRPCSMNLGEFEGTRVGEAC
jgi:hypothetical protein